MAHRNRAAGSVKMRLMNTLGLQSGERPRSNTLPFTAPHPSSKFYASERDSHVPSKYIMKQGSLRKQAGLLRSWQHRWFVLIDNILIQYMAQARGDEAPVARIVLANHIVREIPADPNSEETSAKFLFEVTQGAGGSIASLKVQDSWILCADTDKERRDWIFAIKQVLYSSRGGAIFGKSLDKMMEYELEKNPKTRVPEIVELCVEHLMAHGLEMEGLFRLPGRNKMVKQLKEGFDAGGSRPSFKDIDVHTVASLLKTYLRELPESIIPFDHYEKVMKVITRVRPLDKEQAVRELAAALSVLPVYSYNLLKYLCKFLRDVSLHSDVNKMNASNLATVFCQCIIKPDVGNDDDDPALLAGTSTNRMTAVEDMINEFSQIFSLEDSADIFSDDNESFHTCSEQSTPATNGLNRPLLHPDAWSDDVIETVNGRVEDLANYYATLEHCETGSVESGEDTSADGQKPRTCIGSEVYSQVVELQQQLAAAQHRINDLEKELKNVRKAAKEEHDHFEKKLAHEHKSTTRAVHRVMELQSQLEKYSLKYGLLE